MPLIELNTNPTDRQLRLFAGALVPLCTVIVAAIVGWRIGYGTAGFLILVTGVLAAAGGVFRPTLVRPVYVGWMYFSYPIGWLMGHTMIGLVFFLVLTPMGLFMRAMGRDPLQRKFDKSRVSYWEARPPVSDQARYFRQF